MNSTDDHYTYVVRPGVPDVGTFRSLRRAAGMSDRSAEAVAQGLPHTWHGVVVEAAPQDDPAAGRIAGMGRIVGDGGACFQIVDVCVLPEHQGRGLGTRIMAELTGELERRAPATAYVSLIADGDAHRLYARFGFTGTAPRSIGMHRTV
ncbi:GNAT family N-acetyltransferase [Streptomyces albus]|uniref:GNAT family N-acetyltransferase n=1 Tax=Streptomyces sp. NRRL F-5917 TaxID=1463873 RepID=UPI0004BE6694|nr:GNAT family N-acetyltransferase [Streptomyces sp. NRRL F-5917]KPC95827.1 GNAT family acetyltransferase [Streptomyces sp. NRRL F-6602]